MPADPSPAAPRLRAPHAAFRVDARVLVRDLVVVMFTLEALVVVFDVWLGYGRVFATPDLRAFFDATLEGGFASWLAVTQTALVALTLAAMAAAYRQMGYPRRRWGGWAALAACFAYLAFDDGTQFHERMGTAFAEAEASGRGIGAAFPSYYWQLLFGPLFLGMAVFMAGFLAQELRSARLRLLVGVAFGLLAFAVVLDFVDGLDADHPMNLYARLAEGHDALAFSLFGVRAFEAAIHLSRALEEAVEMAAMTTLWAVFLLHFAGTAAEVRLRWGPVRSPRAPRRPAGVRQLPYPYARSIPSLFRQSARVLTWSWR
ncbi:MAG TPA: hypothetical protein VD962_04330 [Rubricoccaceae bacterium]|nr:hypothetical protein [Rubricoccaceae bacterium]